MPSLNGVGHKEQDEFVPDERLYRPRSRTFHELLSQLSLQHDLEVSLAAENARADASLKNGFCKRQESPLRQAAIEEELGQKASSDHEVQPREIERSKASDSTRGTVYSSSQNRSPSRVDSPSKFFYTKKSQTQSVRISDYTVKSAATRLVNLDEDRQRQDADDSKESKDIDQSESVKRAYSTRTQSPKWFESEDDQAIKPSFSQRQPGEISQGFHKPKIQRWREVVGEMRLIPSRTKLFMAEPVITTMFGNVRKTVASKGSKSSKGVRKPEAGRGTTTSNMCAMSMSIRDALMNGDSRVSRDAKFSEQGVSTISRAASSVFQDVLFDLHDWWSEPASPNSRGLKSKKLRKVEFGGRDSRLNPSDSNLTQLHSLVLKPQGYPLLLWTALGLVSIAYDFFTVPMLVFPLPDSGFTFFMAWYSLVFWNIDLMVKFRTGFYSTDGISETDPWLIAVHYLKTWFIVDLALLILEWILFFLFDSEETTAGSTGRVVRFARFFRMARLIRLIRMRHHMGMLRDYLCSELAVARFTIAKTVLGILAINHLIACMWFLIGEHLSEHGWTTHLHNCEFWCQYTSALHWSVVQFGVGDSNIMPESDGERTFNIVVLFFALVVFSSVVSSITHAMSQLGTLRHDQVMQFAMFHRFCRENHVSKSLTRRVQRHLEYAYDQRVRQIQIKEVRLFELLSGPLKDEVLFSIWRPHVTRHTLFARLCRRDVHVMHMVARSAFADVHLAPHDVLFSFGQVAERMYFLAKGGFEYLSAHGHGHSTTTLWLCEAALWCPWVHVGEIRGHTECKFVSLNAQQFGLTCGLYPATFMRVRRYALHYIDNLNQQSIEELTDVDEGMLVDAMHLSSTGDDPPLRSPVSMVRQIWGWLLGHEPEEMMTRTDTSERAEQHMEQVEQ